MQTRRIKGTKQYSNSKNFNHDEFWLLMEEWSKDNIVLVSELQAPSNWRCIWEGEIIRSHKSQDKLAIEKLFIT